MDVGSEFDTCRREATHSLLASATDMQTVGARLAQVEVHLAAAGAREEAWRLADAHAKARAEHEAVLPLRETEPEPSGIFSSHAIEQVDTAELGNNTPSPPTGGEAGSGRGTPRSS